LKAYDYRGHTPADFPVVARHSREILSLPIYPEITEEQQQCVADSVRAFYSGPVASSP
jgi:dTDP-4-amino-4,6-dideoxygalactose transaminase